MPDIEKIIDNLNLPKQILDKSEALLKTLFGQSFDELGGMIADQVRVRRFKNQIKIFQDAQTILQEKGINPKKVSLKVLAPLIEYSSYEEDDFLQGKWAKLITNILTKDLSINLQQNAIDILNKISTQEAFIIEYMYRAFLKWRSDSHQKDVNNHKDWVQTNGDKFAKDLIESGEPYTLESFLEFHGKELKDYKLHWLTFELTEISEHFKLSESDNELAISNLVALGLINWETQVDVTNTSYDGKYDSKVHVEVEVNDSKNVRLTKLGFEFVTLCNS